MTNKNIQENWFKNPKDEKTLATVNWSSLDQKLKVHILEAKKSGLKLYKERNCQHRNPNSS